MRVKKKGNPYSFVMDPTDLRSMDFLKFNLQQHAEGDGSGDGAGGDGGSGGQQFKEIKDPVTGKAVKIPAELEALFGHVISSTREKTKEEYKPILEKVSKLEGTEGELEEVRAQLEKMRLDSLSAEERAAENAKKAIAEHERKAKEATEIATTWQKRFNETTIRNDILSSFAGSKLCNPEQVAILLEREGGARVEEVVDEVTGKPTGRYETRVTLILENEKTHQMERVDGTPKELFKKWIAMDINSHHVQADIKPGAGTGKKVQMPDGSKMDLSQLDPVARMTIAREQGAK